MRPLAAPTLLLTALLMLTGCTGDEPPEPENGGSYVPAPAVADPTATATPPGTPETDFLTIVRANTPAGSPLAGVPDEQVVAAGNAACERLGAGDAPETITVIDGEQPDDAGGFPESSVIVDAATRTMCP
ncbi:DUF732 domain-containing protein [Microbacterium sp. NPDC016588]